MTKRPPEKLSPVPCAASGPASSDPSVPWATSPQIAPSKDGGSTATRDQGRSLCVVGWLGRTLCLNRCTAGHWLVSAHAHQIASNVTRIRKILQRMACEDDDNAEEEE